MDIILNHRQQEILNQLISNGEVKISGLRGMFNVSEMTLRRDLEKLEQAGQVKRTFGGAILTGRDIELNKRTEIFIEEKIKIGRMAARFVQQGDSIFIDGGSTTSQLARLLKPDLDITVVTNALNIAVELQGKHISTIVVGGALMEKTSTLVGPNAIEMISRMAFHRIFLGSTGLTISHGFSNSNMHEAEIKRLAMRQASEVNIMLDHTKFGLKSLFSFAEFSAVDRIITDRLPEQEFLEECRNNEVEVVASE